MELDESTRLILLPKDESAFDILSLPFGSSKLKILASNDQLYEVREIVGFSEYDERPEPRLPSGGAVKSAIIELKSGPGAVLKNPALLSCTPWNVVYYVLNRMYLQKDVYTSRFQTLDDILDSFQLENHATLALKIEQCFENLCTTIIENGDTFYKFSVDRAFAFLSGRINSLRELLVATPEFALSTMIRGSMVVGSEEPPSDLLNLQTLKWSIDLVCGSYMSEKVKNDYLTHAQIDFRPLDTFFKEHESRKRALAAVEDNMDSVVLTTKNAKTGAKKVKGKPKKPANKVAVGKGALDSFFKRS